MMHYFRSPPRPRPRPRLRPRPYASRPKAPVPCVAKAGSNVAARIELTIQTGGVDRDVRMRAQESARSLGGRHQTDHPDIAAAARLELLGGVLGGPAGGEHRIDQQHGAAGNVGGELRIVLVRLE